MTGSSKTFPEQVRKIRSQLSISQEESAHELRVSFATINCWGNGKTTPFKLALAPFNAFCDNMAAQGKLHLGDSEE